MQYLLPMIFGFLSGTSVGFVLVYLFPGQFQTMLAQVIAGIIAGAIFGAIIGSISGDANASGDMGTHRLLIAAFLRDRRRARRTKLGVVWVFFKYMPWPTPI